MSVLTLNRLTWHQSEKRRRLRLFIPPLPALHTSAPATAPDAPLSARSTSSATGGFSMEDALRYSFVVWFGDEQTTVLWTADMNTGRNTSPPTWGAHLEDAIVDAFSLPRGSRLTLSYLDRDGRATTLTRDAAYDQFWDTLPRSSQHAATGKHGRLDVRRVEVERAEPAMCQIALGERKRLFWCSLDDSAWEDIQLGVQQAFGLPKSSRVAFSVYDDEEDEITICDPFSWRILLSLLAIAPAPPKPVRITITSVNGSPSSPTDAASVTGTESAIGDSRTLIPLPYLGASKVRFFVGETSATFWFRNTHTDADAFLVNFKVLWARAASVLGGGASAFPEMATFDHKGRLVTLSTQLCWKTYASILGTYEKPFNKIEMHIKPPGADAIAPPSSPPAAGQKGSRFQIRAVGPRAPVLVFVHRQALHIAVWPPRIDEPPVAEWSRAQAHIRELFKVPALSSCTLSYVDADHTQQIITSPEAWQMFVTFARSDVNKIRILSLAYQGETPTATTRPPLPQAHISSPPTTPASVSRRAVRISTAVSSSSPSTRSLALDPPPAYAHGGYNRASSFSNLKAPLHPTPSTSSASTASVAHRGPMVSPSSVRSPPPTRALPAPPSAPLPPIPAQPLPPPISPPPLSISLPPIVPLSPLPALSSAPRVRSPIPPKMQAHSQQASTASSTKSVGTLERELADAREEIARLRAGRDHSTQTIVQLTAEIARLAQENAALQKEREAILAASSL